MTTFDIIKKLADDQQISMVQLEETLGFSRNSIYAWKKSRPSVDKLEKVADYFHVSTDYLLNRNDSHPAVYSSIATVASNPTILKILKGLTRLDNSHQQRVLAYTDAQVEDQQRIADLPETLAAHQADDHIINDAEAKYIADGLDEIARRHESKK